MANHVSGYISLENASEAGQKVWDEFVVGTIEKHKDNYETHLGHFLFEEKDGEFVDWNFDKMCEECKQLREQRPRFAAAMRILELQPRANGLPWQARL